MRAPPDPRMFEPGSVRQRAGRRGVGRQDRDEGEVPREQIGCTLAEQRAGDSNDRDVVFTGSRKIAVYAYCLQIR